jgi:hypothetical protein
MVWSFPLPQSRGGHLSDMKNGWVGMVKIHVLLTVWQ